MKILALLLIPFAAFAGTEPINVNTADGFVKKTSSGVGELAKPINFCQVAVAGIPFLSLADTPTTYSGQALKVVRVNSGGTALEFASSGSGTGTVTSITATSPIVVAPSPITTTGVISVTGAALSKGDDTNVTLTLTGTPTTALLQATTITAGWSGQLALGRGGTAANLSDPGANVLWGWDDTDNAIKFITIGTGLAYDHSSHTVSATAQAQSHSVSFIVDGAGQVLSTGTKNPIKIPFGGTLTGWLLIAKPSGSVTVDILRAADGAGLPVTSIVGGGGTKPALSSAVENSSTSFTSWTSTTLTAKDNMAISLSGITTSTYCALTLYYQ